MSDIHVEAFRVEAKELLADLELSLLELEKDTENEELISKIFRALHTIKGSGGMFGFDDIAMFTHDIETCYNLVRDHKLTVTKELIDLTLQARDHIQQMLFAQDEETVDAERTAYLLENFRRIVQGFSAIEEERTPVQIKKDSTSTSSLFMVKFFPEAHIFNSGTNLLPLLEELRELGSAVIKCDSEKIRTLSELDVESNALGWYVLVNTTQRIESIKDVFIFVEDDCEIKIEELKVSNSDLVWEHISRYFDNLLDTIKDFSFSEFKLRIESEAQKYVPDLVSAQKKRKEPSEAKHETESASSIRVSAEKLDELVNLVGELVTIQARLNQTALSKNDAQLIAISEEVERLTWDLRDSALNIRMLPIGTTFSKFTRLVRDLSQELGKDIEMTTEGAETELDKTVIEKLNDPLIHIIRNSIDHGIETPEQRRKAGKPEKGTIHLQAAHSAGNVLVQIKDDGAGINKQAVVKKAIQNGLITEDQTLTDHEVYNLMFLPGFSTAKTVTNVSGRGVGMDVVKRAIESLRGSIEVDSVEGVGTTISLKLPLTLAIIDGLLVQVEDNSFVLPLSSVSECIELTQNNRANAHGRNIVKLRGEIVPYIDLREFFTISGNHPEIEQVVIADIAGMRVGFVVDRVIGQHQTVLKTLGKMYRDIEGISGATILGDGSVALILDTLKLASMAEHLEKNLLEAI